jgi:hypothetical protein
MRVAAGLCSPCPRAEPKVLLLLYFYVRMVVQMCKCRGYLVLEEDYGKSFEDWMQEYGNKPKTEDRPRRKDLNFVHAHDENELGWFNYLFEDYMTKLDFRVFSICSLHFTSLRSPHLCAQGRCLDPTTTFVSD